MSVSPKIEGDDTICLYNIGIEVGGPSFHDHERKLIIEFI